jgi:N-acetylneuraminic acid mutarotase
MKFSHRHLLIAISLLIVLAIMNTSIFATLSDSENSRNNSVSAYTSKLWKSTTEDDFYNNTTKMNVLTKASPGNVTLAEATTAYSSLYLLAGGGTTNFYRYYILGNSWAQRASTPQNVGDGGSMAFDNSRYIYAMRGASTKDFWRFDTTTNTWESRANTPGNVGAGGFLRYYSNGLFYALQGGGSTTIWTYNPSTDTWATLPTTLPAINDGASMIVYMNYIYIIRKDPGNLHTFIRAPLTGGAYTDLSPFPAGKFPGTGTSITRGQGAYLQATRGGGGREFYEYNIGTNTWVKLGNTPKNMGLTTGSDLAYDNIKPYVTVGGGSKVLLQYNSTLRTWKSMTPSPVGVSNGANLLYVPFTTGYSASGSLNSSVFDTGTVSAKYDSIFIDKTLPAGTNIIVKVRASNNRVWIPEDPLDPTNLNGTWDLSGAWTAVSGRSISSITGQYVQWRVELTTTVSTNTPVLAEVRLYYRGF